MNYQLGCEGFLPLDGGETNVGLRDQIAALTWVQDNIVTLPDFPFACHVRPLTMPRSDDTLST